MDRTEGAKKIPGAGRARFTASITISKLASSARNTAGASKAISSWAPRSKGADKGILRSVRLEQTMNDNCKLVKKNLIRLSARLAQIDFVADLLQLRVNVQQQSAVP
jgi:hypothetical protein